MNRFSFILSAFVCMVTLAGVTLGCHTVPTADTVYSVGRGIGATTGIVADQAISDTDVRRAVIDVSGDVSKVVPEVGQPIEAAWGPVAREHVDRLVADGSLTSAQGQLVLSGFRLLCVGWTALEDRHPDVRTARDLTNAGISGFFDGFLSTFKENCDDCCSDCTVDARTYRSLKRELRWNWK